MNILVLVKQTFDTEEKITILNNKVVEENIEFVVNPYDEYAIEEAVKVKEEFGGEVTVLSFGPARVEGALRTALAMGADKGILIEQEDDVYDEYAISKLIVLSVKGETYDLILGGNMAVDSGAGQVAIRVAEELGIPHISSVTNLTIMDGMATVEKDVEGDQETIEVALPVMITAQQGLNEPRYPSLPGIMKAKKKPMDRISVKDLRNSQDQLIYRTATIEQFLPEKKPAGRILAGEIPQKVQELMQLLRNEAKVI